MNRHPETLPAHRRAQGRPLDRLSPREMEVVELLAQGLRYKEIASELGISFETVRTHLRRLYLKLGATSRTEASIMYIKQLNLPAQHTERLNVPHSGDPA